MEINGNISKIIYKDNKSGYSIFKVRTQQPCLGKNDWGEVTLKGFCPTVRDKFPLFISGTYDESQKSYINISVDFSENNYYISQYLKEFPTLGDRKASKCAEYLKEGMTKDQLLEKFTALMDINLAREILDEIFEVKNIVEARKILAPYDCLDLSSIQRIVHNSGGLEKFVEDPYFMGIELNIPISVCDDLGMKSKIDLNHQRDRYLKGLLSYKTYNDGNTFLTPKETKSGFNSIERKSPYFKIPNSLSAVAGRTGSLFPDVGAGFVLKRLSDCEDEAVREVERLERTAKPLKHSPSTIPGIEERLNIKYAFQQKKCFELLNSTGLKIVTGGPGTGKTTTIRGILMDLMDNYPDMVIKLCAPTGRAAQRLSESTEMPASTVHRLLEMAPFGYGELICKNKYNPIEADVVVVDEASMLDIEIFSKLLCALKDGTLLILMGDIDQLMSVGPGSVLNDLIDAGIKTFMLTEVYRQAKDSNIILNAKVINTGKIKFVEGSDFHYKICKTEKEVFEETLHDCLKKHNKDNFFNCQILTPQHDFLTGTKNLNRFLQEEINKSFVGQKFYLYGMTRFRVGDKVLLTNNNYSEGYYNGDIGIIEDIFSNGILINRLSSSKIVIENDNMKDVSLAYGMTIHKSQGSEFPNVILPFILKIKPMLVKNLPYTGITRAKKYVGIYAQEDALEIAAKQTVTRNTNFSEKLYECIKRINKA